MATISNTPRPGYAWDATDNCWYPIGTGPHTHGDYITSGSAINPTIVDAKGDIIAATAADTVARLAVGANDTILTADSTTATGLKWATPAAGGMTLLSTTTLSGVTTTLSSIPQEYTNLQLVIEGYTGNTGNSVLRVAPNGTNNLTSSQYLEGYGSSGISASYDEDISYVYPNRNRGSLRTSANNVSVVTFYNYTSSTGYKPFNSVSYVIGTDSNRYYTVGGGVFASNSAITSLNIQYGGTNTFAGGTIKLYGVK
jgi:hypothetical protein